MILHPALAPAFAPAFAPAGVPAGAPWFGRGAPVWMGILNATPDSFSDGGRYATTPAALVRAQELLASGATVLDVGGVSTRPGAAEVPFDEEWSRVAPLLEALRASHPQACLSLDTSSPRVLARAASAGLIDLANDVGAGRKQEDGTTTFDVCARYNLPLVLMHMQGEPGTMQREPRYGDVVGEVMAFLAARAAAARAAGVAAVAVDPGIGFGKTLDHNLALLSATGMEALGSLGYPVLIGLSRKRFLAELEERRAAPRPDVLTLAASRDGLSKAWELRAADRGAILIRSHRAPGETPPEPVDFPPES